MERATTDTLKPTATQWADFKALCLAQGCRVLVKEEKAFRSVKPCASGLYKHIGLVRIEGEQ
ncbi:MAG: hypothetical protein AB1631_34610, partial [Acidobacteriota bacterium]